MAIGADCVIKIKLHKGIKSGGLSVHVLNRDEHPPAHAHVVEGNDSKNGSYCRVKLGGAGDVGDKTLDPVLWDNYGLSEKQARLAEELVKAHVTECWEEWRKFHGDKR